MSDVKPNARVTAADRIFTVAERIVDRSGKLIRKGGGFDRLTLVEALADIKARQRSHEKSGHERKRDVYWAWTPEHAGCSPKYIYEWTIERKS